MTIKVDHEQMILDGKLEGHFELEIAYVSEKEGGVDEETGKEYSPRFNVKYRTVTRAVYDDEGNLLETVETNPSRDFWVTTYPTGTSVRKLTNAYKLARGQEVPQTVNPQTGKYEVDLSAAYDELIGTRLWNKVFLNKWDDETGRLKGAKEQITSTWTHEPPTTIYIPETTDETSGSD